MTREGIAESVGTQDFNWHKTDTDVKGRNICHLRIVVTHIIGHYFDPEDENTQVDVQEKFLYHKVILEKWAKECCLTAPISFKIPKEEDRYKVKIFHKYVPKTIRAQAGERKCFCNIHNLCLRCGTGISSNITQESL